MKNLSLIISILALTGVILLSVNQFRGAGKSNDNAAIPAKTGEGGGGCKIAFVNIDSLEAHYELLKSKREDFKRRQSQMEAELQRSAEQMQKDIEEVQKKAQANTLTQSEYETAQKRIGQMQQSLENRKQSMTEQLMKEEDEFNKSMKSKLDTVLVEYNKDKHFNYILSFSGSGSALLYGNKMFDITKEIAEGMNASKK